VNATNTSPVYSGSYSISDTLGNYDALFFECTQCFSTLLYKGVEFWIFGGTQISGGQLIGLSLITVVGGASTPQGTFAVGDLIDGGEIPYNQWTRVYLDFDSVPPGTYDGVWLQASSSTPQGFVYVDDVIILTRYNGSNPSTTTTTGSNNFATTTSGSGTTTGHGTTTSFGSSTKSSSTTTQKSVSTTSSSSDSGSGGSLVSSSVSLFDNIYAAIIVCLSCVFVQVFVI